MKLHPGCPSTGSVTATTIKSQSSSNLGLRQFMPVYELRLPTLMKMHLPKARSLIASGPKRDGRGAPTVTRGSEKVARTPIVSKT
jgi:hypothetical protein